MYAPYGGYIASSQSSIKKRIPFQTSFLFSYTVVLLDTTTKVFFAKAFYISSMGYLQVALKTSDAQAKRLASGLAIRVTKAHIGGDKKIWVTGAQAKKIAGIASGEHGYGLIRLGRPALKKMAVQAMEGGSFGSFFSSIGNTIKDTVTKPSGIMGLASLSPTPFAPALRLGSMGARFAGHGVTKGASLAAYHKSVEDALRNMGFGPSHIDHLKGNGLFSDLWSGVRKLATFLKPYVKEEGAKLLQTYGPKLAAAAMKRMSGQSVGHGERAPNRGGQAYMVKFSPAQLRYMRGNGLFSSALSSFGLGVSAKGGCSVSSAHAVRASACGSKKAAPKSVKKTTKKKGLGLITLGSLRG